MIDDKPEDGRKYHIGDRVEFTDDEGNKVPGVVHGVRYQQGHYELIGAHRPDMHSPEGPDNLPIPGTGQMELVKGTESQRHSFEYIMVHEHEHKAWHETEKNNQAKINRNEEKAKRNQKIIDQHKGSVNKTDPHHPDNFKKMPPLEDHESVEPLPDMKQHIRIHEEDD